jgi:very-short-patch-repair endonuclease
MKRDEKARLLAETQLGLVHRRQLADLGYTPNQVRRLRDSRVLQRVGHKVFRVAGSADIPRQRVLAAVLEAGPGTALSHTSAASFWGYRGYDVQPIHAIRARCGTRRSTLAILHEPRLLLREHVTRRGPIPLTTPSRTLFDLASMVDAERLARAVDDALVQRQTNAFALHRMLELFARRGRTGITAMREVLEVRGHDYRPPESNLERRVMKALSDGGLPPFERQVDVGDHEGWIARVDFLCRALRFVLLVDGDRWHSMLSDRAADDRQAMRLERAGYTVWRIPETVALSPPAHIVASVREGLVLARRAS